MPAGEKTRSAISASQSNEIELEGHLEEPRAALGEGHLPADGVLDPPQLHAPVPRHRALAPAAVDPAGTRASANRFSPSLGRGAIASRSTARGVGLGWATIAGTC